MIEPAAATGVAFQPTEYMIRRHGAGLLLLCDHARNTVPPGYGDLGVPAEQFERHIGYDIGARAVTVELARRLKAPGLPDHLFPSADRPEPGRATTRP